MRKKTNKKVSNKDHTCEFKPLLMNPSKSICVICGKVIDTK